MYNVPPIWETPIEILNPWTSMWTRPRATMRGILATNPTRHVLLLSVITGIAGAFDRAASESMGDTTSLKTIIFLALLLGPFFGILGLFIAGAMLRWTGSWLGGVASSEQVRAAVAWSSVPTIWGLLLWIPYLALLGGDMFGSELGFDLDSPQGIMLLALAAAELILGIWAFVVFLKCLGEAHRFSAWKALGASLLAGLILIVPLVCIIVVLFSAG